MSAPRKVCQPKVDLDITRERLLRLGLQHAADVLFRLEELLAALKRDADLPPARLRRRKYNSLDHHR